MRKFNVTTQLTGLALAVATAACAPHAARAQATPDAPATPASPAAPARPALPAEAAPTTAQVFDQAQRLRDQIIGRSRQGADLQRAAADIARLDSDLVKFKDFNFSPAFFRSPSPDTPMVITTEPLDAAAQAELREDLSVMDKLLRDEMARAGGAEQSAMGIKLMLVGRSAPQYVEGAGAVFASTVSFPLAPVGAGGRKDGDRPRDPASKWDQAKRDLNGYQAPRKGPKGEPAEPPVFDPAKLEQLKAALIRALPEAANFRHLKDNESVFVTVSGTDDGGAPVRLTMKATKADIDAAAAGKITPDDFAKRVTQRVG